MLEKYREDIVLSSFLKKSNLTHAQLDTLLAWGADVGFSKKTELRDKQKVSKGSFFRTLGQAQINIEGSVYTLLLLAYLGKIPTIKFAQLAKTLELMSKLKDMETDAPNLQRLLEAAVDFVEQFSSRRKRSL